MFLEMTPNLDTIIEGMLYRRQHQLNSPKLTDVIKFLRFHFWPICNLDSLKLYVNIWKMSHACPASKVIDAI